MGKERKQVKVDSAQKNQMIALVKKAVNYRIEKKYPNKKACAEAAFDDFKETSGIDPLTFTTIDCVAHHIGTLEKIYETGEKPASGKTKNIQTIIIEEVYPETYGKLPVKETKQLTVEDVCELERNEMPEDPPQPDPEPIVSISNLSAKDKKDLAMYAIDQYYFFLKQLTGVI